MILSAGTTLKALASIPDVISFTVFGRNTTGSTPLPQPLGQGLLKAIKTFMYVSQGDVTIESIQFANTTAQTVTGIFVYLDNLQIAGAFTLLPNGTLTYSDNTWNSNDNSGSHIVGVGTSKITLGPVAPLDPVVGDLWLQT